MAAKKTSKSKAPSKRTSKPAVNKSEFIRSNADKPPQEIVKLAKSKGFELSLPMVYTIRSELRKKQGKSSPVPKKASQTFPKASGSLKEAELTFGKFILRLGVERAQELFDQTRVKVENSLK